ncbi:hypothetical protein [Sinomonas gamaensis]|uniref:hypothetical protein n=1 Tax=Sinomonas gamaensis TaxID=2565624 RepID=UPI0011099C51|nr:hypothetical protein [Sinomonas gamaensis]
MASKYLASSSFETTPEEDYPKLPLDELIEYLRFIHTAAGRLRKLLQDIPGIQYLEWMQLLNQLNTLSSTQIAQEFMEKRRSFLAIIDGINNSWPADTQVVRLPRELWIPPTLFPEGPVLLEP